MHGTMQISTFLCVVAHINCARIPESPCPQLFQYRQNNDGYTYGELEVPYSQGNFEVAINMSVAAYLNDDQNIQIQRITPNEDIVPGASLLFEIYFPVQQSIPKLTRIEVNGAEVCYGPRAMLQSGGAVTDLWSKVSINVANRFNTAPYPGNTGFNAGPFSGNNHNSGPFSGNSFNTALLSGFNPTSFSGDTYNAQPQSSNSFSTALLSNNKFNKVPFTDNKFSSVPFANNIFNPAPKPDSTQSKWPFAPHTVTKTTSKPPLFWFNYDDFPVTDYVLGVPKPTPRPFVPYNKVTTTPKSIVTTSRKTIVQRNPEDYLQCGDPSFALVNYVRGGDIVEPGEYPWLVALLYQETTRYDYRCTGSLISDRHIITAAHCVQSRNGSLVSLNNLVMVIGKTDISYWASSSVIRDAKNIVVHPNYRPGTGHGDLAIINLHETVPLTQDIKPLCLWSGSFDLNEVVGRSGVVAGWGRNGSGTGQFMVQAQQIEIPIVAQDTCLWSNAAFSSVTSNLTFCAGARKQKGPCTGDSGGPFMMLRNNKWVLRGIVSYALERRGFCELTDYAVFVDAAKLSDWIKNTMKKLV